uniref:Ig-like domain-containing protein n=1 Tax=Romanomermis culicivorax TaxID=13658 RepID=A0A915I866_ROMCU
MKYLDSIFKSSELKITVQAKPSLYVLVQETTWPWRGEPFKLLCDVRNIDYPVSYYEWYKNGIIVDYADDQVHTKNILVILRKSIECDDCANNLKKSLDMARIRNVEVVLVKPLKMEKSPIAHRILYHKKDGLKSIKKPLLEMIRKLASSFCRSG